MMETHLVDKHVKDGQDRVRVRVLPVGLDSGTNGRLGQDQLGQLVQMEKVRVALKELDEEPFHGLVVDLGFEVEEFKVDVYASLCECGVSRGSRCAQRCSRLGRCPDRGPRLAFASTLPVDGHEDCKFGLLQAVLRP
jgi:hypothetical protein